MWLGPAFAAPLPDDVLTCATETDSARRLSCYDQVAAELKKMGTASAGTSSATVADSARHAASNTAAATAAASPAASANSTAHTGTQSKDEAEFGVQAGPLARKRQLVQPRQITAVVSRIQHRADGELVMALDNGQVWRQIEPVAYFPLEVGDKVQISAAAFGSYLLSAPSKRATRVTRIQ
jgi:hypothetical protein